jgi:hypothetical protein
MSVCEPEFDGPLPRAVASAVQSTTGAAVAPQSRRLRSGGVRALTLGLIATLAGLWGLPHAASAHGTSIPNASSYLARVSETCPGCEAKVVDGDLRMWLRVPPRETVEVIDYLGAPYLRFSRAGVEVNSNSVMWYLDHTPYELPPPRLKRSTPPRWEAVSSGHEFTWVDGRLHALASIALPPGTAYVGKWSIPVRVNGRLRRIGGGVWHAEDPSIIWFWPIIVLLACMLAAWRLHRRELDERIARAAALAALVALGVTAVGKQLHGRPTVDAGQVVVLALVLAVLAAATWYLLSRRPRYFFYFLVSMLTLVGDLELIPTLLHGYVLLAMPALLARIAAVVCASCGVALLLSTFRMAEDLEDVGRLAVPEPS